VDGKIKSEVNVMGLFKRPFWRKTKKEETAGLGMQGQPLEVISGPTPHPDHYDRHRNAARIAQMEAAIAHFKSIGQEGHEKVAELKAELAKHLKIRELFHSGEDK
jgi:hypothetical protein